MKRAGWAVIGIAFIALGGIALLSWFAGLDRDESTRTFQDVTEFVFDVENASIDVAPGGDDAVVEMSVNTGLFGADVELEQDGETLRLVQDCPFFLFGWGCRGSFEVSLPSAANVAGETSNGPVSVAGIGGLVDVVTSNGAITIADLSSDVAVDTSNGAISGSGLRSAVVRGSTSNGRIGLSFAESPESVTLVTSNGAVEVVLPPDAPPYRLSTSTSNGDVTNDIRTDPGASQTIAIETSNGDITIRYGG